MKKNILITGGKGFLGRAIAAKFKQDGHHVIGVGHGLWNKNEFELAGFDRWLDLHLSLSNLLGLGESIDLVIHCAGCSSVQDADVAPLENYNKTVQSSLELLEYIRLYHPTALFIYPSSAAVYGAQDDNPIKETNRLNPISTYGFHKRMVEEACELYAKNYGVKVAIARFFSIYGPGLQKQLLWDATLKLCRADNEISFCGTGEETRDWIHVKDAANLILRLSEMNSPFMIVNGGGGIKTTTRTIVEMLRDELNYSIKIKFNNIVREGDPKYYFADISTTKQIGWFPDIPLVHGINEYLTWFRQYHD